MSLFPALGGGLSGGGNGGITGADEVPIVGAQVYLSANQLITADTWTKVAFNASDHNDGLFSLVNNNFVAPADDDYQFLGQAVYNVDDLAASGSHTPNGPDSVAIRLYLNGSPVPRTEYKWINEWGLGRSFLVTQWRGRLTAGDTVDMRCFMEARNSYLEGLTTTLSVGA